MDFEVVDKIADAETIVVGHPIRELPALRARALEQGIGGSQKGVAIVRLADGTMRLAEVH